MKGNTKYTALEILTAAGVEKPEEVLGKVAVTIAGISGVVNPNHVILIPETEKIVVIVGNEAKEVAIEGVTESQEVSKGTRAVLDEEGKKENEKIEAHQDEKLHEQVRKEKEEAKK